MVQQYDLDGDLIREYSGVNEAAKAIGKLDDATSIAKCCKGKRKTAYGYIWKYKEAT